MKIIDVTTDNNDLFCLCLEDWSDEAQEAGSKRREWFDRCRQRGLRGKLAVDDDGVEGGLIQYGPIENSFVDGAGLYFIYCIFVHGHKRGRGNFIRWRSSTDAASPIEAPAAAHVCSRAATRSPINYYQFTTN